jgi:1,2-phenylacetyl-CoA epoxidase catalytic subunit
MNELQQPDASRFVAGLVAEMEQLFARLGREGALEAESKGRVEIVTLLELALQSEVEASELAGFWMPTTPEIDVKMAFARQCGDEMKHYHLIRKRLGELGRDTSALDPLADGYTPLYHYLKGLRSTVERVAAGPFAREAIAEVRNEQFIALCERLGDPETAALYRDVIQPEEILHHRLGRDLLEKYCTTPELQAAATAATRNTLAIADELSSLAERSTGMHPIPAS